MYLTGSYSADELRDILYEKGVRSKTGKKIPHSVMVRMLKNPFYAGLMAWNGQRHMGRHEPIITLAEHQRIVQIIDAHNLHACRRRKHGFLLRGFVYCNICGHRYTAETHPAKHKSYYRCATRREHSNLRQNVEVDVLERQVDEQFKTIQFSPKFIAAVTKRLQQLHATHKSTAQERKQVFSNQQKAIEQKRDKAEEKLLAGILSDDAFVRLRKGFTEQLQQIQEQIATLDSHASVTLTLCTNPQSPAQHLPNIQKSPGRLETAVPGDFLGTVSRAGQRNREGCAHGTDSRPSAGTRSSIKLQEAGQPAAYSNSSKRAISQVATRKATHD